MLLYLSESKDGMLVGTEEGHNVGKFVGVVDGTDNGTIVGKDEGSPDGDLWVKPQKDGT